MENVNRPDSESFIKGIKRRTRRKYSPEEKIRVVLAGMRGEDSVSAICRKENLAEGMYYKWMKDFLEAGKKRLSGDTKRQANSSEVNTLRNKINDLKELVAELSLENMKNKKSLNGAD